MPTTAPPEAPPSLPRELGLWDTTMLVMGGIIGAGIFYAPHKVALEQPALAGILLAWSLGGVLAMSGAIVFAELGGLFPHTGGQYVYLRAAYGRALAFFFGWSLLAIITSGAVAVIAGICTLNLNIALENLLPGQPREILGPAGQRALGAGLIAAITWINVRGVRLGATIHNVLMALKIASILLVTALGLAVLAGAEHSTPAAALPGALGASAIRWDRLGVALLAVLFTCGGWNNAAAVAGEIRDAQRTLPRAILLGTGMVMALYIALNLAVVEILGAGGLAASSTPVADAAGTVLGGWGGAAVAGMIVLSTLGIIHALILMIPRIFYAMAHDGVFLRLCGARHRRHATPWVAIVLLGSFSLVHLFTGDIGPVLDSIVVVDWIFFSLCAASYFIFRRRLPDAPRPYRASAHPWVPLIFLLLSLSIVVCTTLQIDYACLLRPAILMTIGLVLLLVHLRRAT